jgi:enoyl-CoA hydratase
MALVTSTRNDLVTTIVMDDGKVNVMSVNMMRELNAALDAAERDGTAVLLTGRENIFSAGFDLAVFKQGKGPLLEMLEAGARTAERLLSFPAPVVVACGGHAIAMGAFLLLAADIRIGVRGGQSKIAVNEVQIGLTVPRFALELCRHRLTPAHFSRAPLTADGYDPDQALIAGFLDSLAAVGDLLAAAQDRAAAMAALPRSPFTSTKRRVREGVVAAGRLAIKEDIEEWRERFA